MKIIAGSARGRNIETIEGQLTRPTLAKVRESLFGMLQFELYEKAVLDLFAGSGALGLESLSRGARSAYFSDMNRKCVEVIRRNASMLGFEGKATLVCSDYLSVLRTLAVQSTSFDIIFLDPPYASPYGQIALNTIFEQKLLAEGGTVALEHSVGAEFELPFGCKCRLNRAYGETALSLFIWERSGNL